MSLNYTEEELNLLANTPSVIGTAMAFSGSSGLFGTGKEMFASVQAIMAGVKNYPNNALIQAILPSVQGGASEAMDKMKKVRDWGVARYKAKEVNSAEKFQAYAIEDCKAVCALLAAKSSPQEADEYKQWTLSIAEKAAMAASEGGFMGFGGDQYSDNEKKFMSAIESAMGTSV